MSGVRIIPDGQNLLQGEGLESLINRLADSRLPSGAALTVAGGYSWFDLPEAKMVTVVGGPLFNQAGGQRTTASGGMDGWRMDAGLENFASSALFNGYTLAFGVRGFYANYQNGTHTHCMYGATTDCAFVNIVDFDPTQSNNTGPFGDLSSFATRNVDYYGVSVDMRVGTWHGGGLKDSGPVAEPSPFKVGVAIRGLDETTKLSAQDPLVSAPVKYSEKVNTQYYGGFVGYEQSYPVSDGWHFGVDATAGLYYASSQYQGWYSAYAPVGFVYLQDYGTAADSMVAPSFIGTLKVSLDRDLGWGTAGVFGQGEYLSYVPRIAYNNSDQGDFLMSWPISGSQTGTRIKSDDAFNYTTGVKLSIHTN